MRTAAASMGCMLAGNLATRTETDATPGSSSARSAMRPASASSKLAGGPSITVLAMPRSLV